MKIEYPIRLMFGIGNNMVQGFSIVYEKNKKAESINVWYDSDSENNMMELIRFSYKEQSKVIIEKKVNKGFFGKGKVHETIVEIVIKINDTNSGVQE